MSTTRRGGNSTAEAAELPVSDEAILKVAKEVVVKFIEVGQLSPQNFPKIFQEVHAAVRKSARYPDSTP